MFIFIAGSDSFQARQAILRIKEKYLAKNPDGVELIEIDANPSTTLRVNWADLQAVPLFASSRLVIVKEAGLLSTAEQENLAYFLKNLPATTVAVIWDGKALLVSSPLTDALSQAKKIDVSVLEGPKLRSWAKKRAEELGLKADEALIQAVIDSTGSDLWRLETELVYLSHNANSVVGSSKKKPTEPFVIFRYFRSQNWPALRQQLAEDLKSGVPIELTIGSLAAAIRKEIRDIQLKRTLTDLLMDIDVGVKTGLLDDAAAIALLIAHLPKPADDRVQWEASWGETF